MIIGTAELELRLSGCESLKDKRRILRSLLERCRREFRVAIAEVDDQDLWGNACIGAACVSSDPRHAKSILQHVINAFDEDAEVEVVSANLRIERL